MQKLLFAAYSLLRKWKCNQKVLRFGFKKYAEPREVDCLLNSIMVLLLSDAHPTELTRQLDGQPTTFGHDFHFQTKIFVLVKQPF